MVCFLFLSLYIWMSDWSRVFAEKSILSTLSCFCAFVKFWWAILSCIIAKIQWVYF